jgi:hypothetical protein
MRDVVIVVPTILAGAIALVSALEAGWHRPEEASPYLIFLAFLFGVLLLWYRLKVKTADRGKATEARQARSSELRPLPPGLAFVTIPWAVVGVGTPVGVCAMAWFATAVTPTEAPVIWGVAGLLGVTAMVCGTFLLTRLQGSPFATADRTRRNGYANPAANKPEVADPDAFDFVGRRG